MALVWYSQKAAVSVLYQYVDASVLFVLYPYDVILKKKLIFLFNSFYTHMLDTEQNFRELYSFA